MKYFLFTICILCITIPQDVSARKLKPISNIDFVRELYVKVNKTPPALVSKKKHEEIIRRRLKCYETTFQYSERIEKCNLQYNNEIVNQARKAIISSPQIGLFVRNLVMCPIMYNLCSGKTNNNRERCIQFERQCIDYTLDKYWRDEPHRIILNKK